MILERGTPPLLFPLGGSMEIVWKRKLESSSANAESFIFPQILCGPGNVYHVLHDEEGDLPLRAIHIKNDLVDIRYAFAATSKDDIYVQSKDGELFRLNATTGDILFFERGITTGPVSESCVSGSGHVLSIGYEPWAFDFFAPNGSVITAGYEMRAGSNRLIDPTSIEPIWSLGCSTISANNDSFIVGGGPAKSRLDRYSLEGKFETTYDISVEAMKVGYSVDSIARARLRLDGTILATDGFAIFQLSASGKIIGVFEDFVIDGLGLMLSEMFLIDEFDNVWSYCASAVRREAYLVAARFLKH
jgi:outer membrane protein assembly factor BamB